MHFFKVKKIWKSETASCFACLRRKNDLQNEKKKIQNDQNNTSINSHIRGVKWCQVSMIYRDRNFGSSLIQSGALN